MEKISLPTVTLICVDCVEPTRAVRVMEKCKEFCDFGDVKFLTSCPTDYPARVQIDPLVGFEAYSSFMLSQIYKYVNTKMMLVVQYDGYIIRPQFWNPAFLDYDYIGAPWEVWHQGIMVGNGGFSLRSKALMQHVAEHPIRPSVLTAEDYIICVDGQNELRAELFKFAPVELAARFSFERNMSFDITNTFGFHGYYALDRMGIPR